MPIVVAMASGKGGTGTSLLAGNMSLLLATLGKKVVAVDASPGGAGLHGWLGIGEPRRALCDALAPGGPHLSELVMATAIPGLGLVPGETADGWRGALDERGAAILAGQLRELDAEVAVVDLPTGCSDFAVDLFMAADSGVLVMVPEPSSVELGYRFLRAAFARRLRRAGRADLLPGDGLPMPLDVFEQAPEVLPEMTALRAAVVLNCVRSKSDTDLGNGIAMAGGRRLGLALRYVGHVDYDDAVWVSLRRRRALLVEHPESRASKCIEKVIRRVLARDCEYAIGARAADPARPESHYEILEIEPTASDEEIRRAHRRVRKLYGRDSVAVSGLWSREGLDALQRRFDEAYAILMEPVRRKAYDQELFPEGVPTVRPPAAKRRDTLAPPRRPPPALAPDVELSGALMKEVREALGIELHEISERTKIGTAYLGAIEEEAFDRLPAPVYVRGFLVEYAKMLGLDVTRVLDTYYQRFLASRTRAESGA